MSAFRFSELYLVADLSWNNLFIKSLDAEELKVFKVDQLKFYQWWWSLIVPIHYSYVNFYVSFKQRFYVFIHFSFLCIDKYETNVEKHIIHKIFILTEPWIVLLWCFFIMYILETKTNQSRWKYLDSDMTKLMNFCHLQIPSNLASRKSSIGKLTSHILMTFY